jgi:microcystin-dependent protein
VPVETFNYLDSLDPSNPPTSDGLVQGDDHIRGIKAVLKSTFAGVSGAATRLIGSTWGFLAGDGSLSAPAFSFTSEAALGLYRSSAGVMTSTGVLRSVKDVGQVAMFATATVPDGWLVCDGQAVSRITYADLYGKIGTIWGAGDGSTTFNVPPLQDHFPRHRNASGAAGAVGTLQADQNKSHTHGVSGTTASENATHTHGVSGTTGAMSANASHSHQYGQDTFSAGLWGGGSFGGYVNTASNNATTSATNTDHTHAFAVTSGSENQNHQHTFAVTSATGSADGSEARPLSATLLFCIRY